MPKGTFKQIVNDTGIVIRCWSPGHLSRSDSRWASIKTTPACSSGATSVLIVFKTSSGWETRTSATVVETCSEVAYHFELGGAPSSVARDFVNAGGYCKGKTTKPSNPNSGAKAKCKKIRQERIKQVREDLAWYRANGQLGEAALANSLLSALRRSSCTLIPDYSAGDRCNGKYFGYSTQSSVFWCVNGVWRRW